MTDRLRGKVAFITGGGAGIARAASLRFASEGARVVVAELDTDLGKETEALARASGGEATFVQCDVTESDSLKAALDTTVSRYERLDIMFNCAGGGLPGDGSLMDSNPDIWTKTIDLNLIGVMLCCRLGFPHLEAAGGGSIVNVSSLAALKGSVGALGVMYSSMKGAIISLTRSVAARGAESNIRANAIAPGLILTERLLAKQKTLAESSAAATWSAYAANLPGAVGKPEEIASIALFLASDESRLITGALIPAEGGVSMY